MMTHDLLFAAISSLCPDGQFSVRGDVVEWTDPDAPHPSQDEILAAVRLRSRRILVAEIDNAVAEIYARAGRFSEEYKEREADAIGYQSTGFTGPVPRSIAAFATPAGLPPASATGIILAQAHQLRSALADLGELRMRKILVLNAATDDAATAEHAAILHRVAEIAASLL